MGLIAFSAETAMTPDEVTFAKFAQRFESEPCNLAVTQTGLGELVCGPPNHPLELSLDLHKSVVIKTSGSTPFPAGKILSVNGEDFWTPIIDRVFARESTRIGR